jgi:hypothetical protein
MAADELKNAIELFRKSSRLPYPGFHGSNTCDPTNGVWAEHLLNMHDYRQLINESLFSVTFIPGFWDTHYGKAYKNIAGKILNRLIGRGGKTAMRLAPFIYVIAKPH